MQRPHLHRDTLVRHFLPSSPTMSRPNHRSNVPPYLIDIANAAINRTLLGGNPVMSKLLMNFLIPFAFVNLILAALGVYDFFLFPIYCTIANHLHRQAQFYIDHILDQQTHDLVACHPLTMPYSARANTLRNRACPKRLRGLPSCNQAHQAAPPTRLPRFGSMGYRSACQR